MPIERIKSVANQILNRLPAVRSKGEGATKQALILPMLDALGYDIWNPSEVCPEYDADFAVKKFGQKEKVDMAILIDSIPRIYLELKSVDASLEGHAGQLARYFNSTPTVTLGILSNGLEWQFFTDTGDPNVMDTEPFHVTKLDAVDQGLEVLVRFCKSVFSPEAIRDYATELLYTAKMASFFRSELDLKDKDPSEMLIRWILKSEKMYDGIVNSNVVDRFKPIVKSAITRVIREIVRRSITAMEKEAAQGTTPVAPSPIQAVEQTEEPETGEGEPCEESGRSIITTERELQVFAIVKEMFDQSPFATSLIREGRNRKDIPISISYRDTTAYFSVFFNKPFWWVVRVMTESKVKWVGFNIDPVVGESLIPENFHRLDPHVYAEFRVEINGPEDIRYLHQLVFAAFQKTIDDRLGQKAAQDSM